MSDGGSIARRYARALMSIGLETGKLRVIQRELQKVSETFSESEELRNVLRSPHIRQAQRKAVVKTLATRLGITSHVLSTCLLLVDRSRAELLPDISRELEAMVDAHEGVVRAEVVSAAPLSTVYLERLTRALQSATGKKVQIATREDRDLIGGVVTRVGGVVYDGSLRARLSRVRELMLR
jgi:F-type H+-transporting ATPase subunit delta